MSRWIRGRLVLVACLAGTAWCALPGAPRADFTRPAIFDMAAPALKSPLRGAASCAFSSCHGGDGPPGTARSEHTTWVAHDRHARAYDVLLSQRSRIIERNFRGLAKLEDSHPELDAACLYCHSSNVQEAQKGLAAATADGVGCERCHGPSAQWLGEHYSSAWQTLSLEQKEARGFHDMKDLLVRARLCTDCHVGAGDNDVNHDLIAAGHPRLNFELGAFVATMPPHWDVAREKRQQPDLEAKLWAVGQLVSAEQALTLLARRAEVPEKPWPEFAEYDCFACHQSIRSERIHGERGTSVPGGSRTPGSWPWNTWYTALLERAETVGGSEKISLNSLRAEMQKPLPDRAKVTAESKRVAEQLGHAAAQVARSRPDSVAQLGQAFTAIARDDAKGLDSTWDGATQCYLALAALHHALTDLDPSWSNPQRKAALRGLGNQLRFPPGFDSPRNYRPTEFQRWLQPLQAR